MKRFWLGIALMAALLAAGIGTTVAMTHICTPIAHHLQQAAQADTWEQATAHSDRARSRWEAYRRLSASVTDHEPMEQVDALFHALTVYKQQGEHVRFAECCAQLASQTQAIAEAQAINWWNIF